MIERKSMGAALTGAGSSLLSFLGMCVGGVCGAACGVVCVAPLASLLGFSSASVSMWTEHLLPVFTAISAVAFTVAFYSIFRRKEAAACCEEDGTVVAKGPSRWSKSVFWVGLLLTLGFYGYSITQKVQAQSQPLASTCDSSEKGAGASSCSASDKATQTESCSAESKSSCETSAKEGSTEAGVEVSALGEEASEKKAETSSCRGK